MKNALAITIAGLLASSPIAAQESERSPYGPDDTSDVAHETCPDYFDTDWQKTHDGNHPCLDPETGELRMMDGSEVTPDRNQAAEGERASTSTREGDRIAGSDPAAERRCEAPDLGADNDVNALTYTAALNERQTDREELATDFDPSSATAKSVVQLRDRDIEERHIEATIDALDDDDSGAIDKIESLDVRGLADIFARVDLNDDSVIAPAEFRLYFGGRLDEPWCVDGERISRLDDQRDVDRQRS